MYAIIRWKNDDELYPLINDNQTLKLFDTVEQADAHIEQSIADKSLYDGDDCRVISIDEVII